jgi:hypothetical protein
VFQLVKRSTFHSLGGLHSIGIVYLIMERVAVDLFFLSNEATFGWTQQTGHGMICFKNKCHTQCIYQGKVSTS